MKTVLYARVSTRDQKPGNQLRELRKYAKQRGFDVVSEQVDKESGAKADRPGLARVMEMARKREVDAVLVWKFDRFARSTRQLVNALEEFKGLGVDFISYTENVDTSTPAGKALFTMVSAFAEFERDIIRERVLAGLDRARAEGIPLGRPGLERRTVTRMQKLRKAGKGVREIARKLDVSPAVVCKYTS